MDNKEKFIEQMQAVLSKYPEFFIDVCADTGAFITCETCAYYDTPMCDYKQGAYDSRRARCSKREGFLKWVGMPDC